MTILRLSHVEIRVPEAYMGEVNRDLNTRRGRMLGMDAEDGLQVLREHVPQAELFMIYLIMAAVLMFRPEGLFKRETARRI